MTIIRKVDPVQFANREQQIAGRLPVKSFTRLCSLLQTHEGDAEVTIAFGKGENGCPVICGDLKATVTVECQRCLQSMPLDIASEFSVVVLDIDDQSSDDHGLFDAVLVEEGEIDLYDLIEDELVMAMPMAPMHASSSACKASGKYFGKTEIADREMGQKQMPFKDLGKMMTEQDY